jgi:hypothetical protein
MKLLKISRELEERQYIS